MKEVKENEKETEKINRITKRHNFHEKFKASTSGITLIALVVTIIILLILAGVTIATLTGDNRTNNKSSRSIFSNRDI